MFNIYFALSWYFACICTLVLASLLLIQTSFVREVHQPFVAKYQTYKALPDNLIDIKDQEVILDAVDGRAKIIANFFAKYNAPLKSYAETFVEVADKYNLDYRLLPAISMQESHGGKIMPNESYNPFGYGIYGKNVLRFASFDEAIDRVGRGLKADYLEKGLLTPEDIMAKYTPPSLVLGGPWAKAVSSFMEQLE